MIGYIYLTKTKCGHYYVGQHKAQKFDESYFGSGRELKLKQIESCKMIDSADYFYELNSKETYWIRRCFERYGDMCLNMNDYPDTNLGLVFVHKKTNVIAIGTQEMKTLYRITPRKILSIFKGDIKPTNGLFPEDWEMMSYKEYDIRRLNI